jgi:hypothetical protein
MFRRGIIRSASTSEISGQTCRHNNYPPIFSILPEVIDSKFDTVSSRIDINIKNPTIRFRKLPIAIEIVGEELVFVLSNPSIDKDSIQTTKLSKCSFKS